MPDQPLVSIVTPSYNQGEFLEAAIRSVLEQDYAPIEYLVIDGGSQDNSPVIIQRYAPQLAYWEIKPDRGQAHAINKGLQRAQGEILGWLNSDDRLLPGTVRRAVEIFQQHPEVDVVSGRLERIDRLGHRIPTPRLPKDRLEFDRSLALYENVVNQPGSFWRQTIMERAGLLDEELHYALDYEYWIRLLAAGACFRRLDEAVAEFRLSSGSKTVGQADVMARESLRVIDAYLRQPDLPARLGLSAQELERQARRGRGVISLHVVYGSLRRRQWADALRWLWRAHAYHPGVLFDRRWLGLGWAGLQRRLRK